jgi:hypothetical protein
MDGKRGTLHERWQERTEVAYRRMFGGKSQEELATLTQREDLALWRGSGKPRVLLWVAVRESNMAGVCVDGG